MNSRGQDYIDYIEKETEENIQALMKQYGWIHEEAKGYYEAMYYENKFTE